MEPRDLEILKILHKRNNIPASFTDIAKEVKYSMSSVRYRVAMLIGAGLVSQERTQRTARYRSIRITDAGRKALQENGQS